ncbi:MAG: NUMOD4 motif-containing HNH endonuclease [Clostridium sp.]|jgi:hypothetical protein|nr:NUMOD4 motif-containing HNH endonuclease [Clostridium sp.]
METKKEIGGNNPIEIWKPIDGYEGYYEISNLGRVKSLTRSMPHKTHGKWTIKERILKQGRTVPGDKGYMGVVLHSGGGKQTMFRLHRLVAKAFVPNPGRKPEVNHIDGDTYNNRADNLEWVTPKENMAHAKTIGRLSHTEIGRSIVNLTTGEHFESAASAGRKYGVSGDAILKCLYGISKTSAGHEWRTDERKIANG